MMTFKAKLVQVCFVMCLLVSLVGFAFAADMNLDASHLSESHVGAWVLEDGNNSDIWSQAIAGGCQTPDTGLCGGG